MEKVGIPRSLETQLNQEKFFLQKQPMWLCICSSMQFEKTFGNSLWRKVIQLQPMWLCYLRYRDFLTPKFSRPILRLFLRPKIFQTDTRTFFRPTFSTPRPSFLILSKEWEKSRNDMSHSAHHPLHQQTNGHLYILCIRSCSTIREGLKKKIREIQNGICHEGEGVLRVLTFFQKCFFLNHLESSLACRTCFAHSLGFILYTYSSWGDHEYGWIN